MSIKTTLLGNLKDIMSKWYTPTEELNRQFSDINSKLDSLVGFTATVVDKLPSTGKDGIIYLVASEEGVNRNIYDEYIWFNGDFEKIGDTNVGVDMSAYALASDVNNALSLKLDKSEISKYALSSDVNNALSSKSNTNHTHDNVTTSKNGFMIASDKSKLDGIASNANNFSLPTASSSTLGGIKVGSNLSINNGVLSGTGDTTYGTASQSSNGLMSSTDKKKLDGIADGATKITVDSSLSNSSTNAIQNKAVYNALGGKADSGHSHSLPNTNRTLDSNFFEYMMGQVGIVSWWSRSISVSSANRWVTLFVLTNPNIGQPVWSHNIHNGSGTFYFRINSNTNAFQYYSSATGSVPIHPGQLVFVTKNSI